jgi:excisionase family DNA binding protein
MSIRSTAAVLRSTAAALPPQPITVTVQTAKQITGLGLTTIWALIRDGKFQAVRIGRRTLIRYDSIERLLEPSATPQPRPRGRPRKPPVNQKARGLEPSSANDAKCGPHGLPTANPSSAETIGGKLAEATR